MITCHITCPQLVCQLLWRVGCERLNAELDPSSNSIYKLLPLRLRLQRPSERQRLCIMLGLNALAWCAAQQQQLVFWGLCLGCALALALEASLQLLFRLGSQIAPPSRAASDTSSCSLSVAKISRGSNEAKHSPGAPHSSSSWCSGGWALALPLPWKLPCSCSPAWAAR